MQQNNKKIFDLAFFTALAITIFLLENLIPRPFPFLKFGFANIIVLYVLITINFRSALLIAISKTLIGGLLSGLILSPTTLLSLSGSIAALLIMYILYRSPLHFSLIGLSISGAVFHNLSQLIVVRLILIKEHSIFYLTPLLIILGLFTGTLTGYLAYLLISKTVKEDIDEKTDN
ncbi:MAG: hypothetical protein APR54_04120 [Candidatus Cloacimonas sp. SDB]|nr:MAG: hypothetical protein APR54_04120 [Candidatus Cloacimonas sp. SDB]